MKEAIEDGYILNPIRGIVPVSAIMLFGIPDNKSEGFEGDRAMNLFLTIQIQVLMNMVRSMLFGKRKYMLMKSELKQYLSLFCCTAFSNCCISPT